MSCTHVRKVGRMGKWGDTCLNHLLRQIYLRCLILFPGSFDTALGMFCLKAIKMNDAALTQAMFTTLIFFVRLHSFFTLSQNTQSILMQEQGWNKRRIVKWYYLTMKHNSTLYLYLNVHILPRNIFLMITLKQNMHLLEITFHQNITSFL